MSTRTGMAGGREAGVGLVAQAVEDGQHEGGGLAGPGLGGGEDVAALENERDRGRSGRGSGSRTPPRRPCARGRPTGRVNRRSSVAPECGPAAGTDQERDGGPIPARRWTRTADRTAASIAEMDYDRTVTAAATRAHRCRGPIRGRPSGPRLRARPSATRASRDRSSELRGRRRRGPRHRPGTGLQDARRERRRRSSSWPSSRSTGSSTSSAWRLAARGRKADARRAGRRPSERPATSSAGSARSARGGRCRSSSTRRRSSTRRSSCRPAGGVSSSSWHRPTWCVCAARYRHPSRGTMVRADNDVRRLAY